MLLLLLVGRGWQTGMRDLAVAGVEEPVAAAAATELSVAAAAEATAHQ